MKQKLIFLGQQVDPDVEYEWFSSFYGAVHGFRAECKLSGDFMFPQDDLPHPQDYWRGKRFNSDKDTIVMNNLTEVHWDYDSCYPGNERRAAFESDLHWHGGTKAIHAFDEVVITIAHKMESEYDNY